MAENYNNNQHLDNFFNNTQGTLLHQEDPPIPTPATTSSDGEANSAKRPDPFDFFGKGTTASMQAGQQQVDRSYTPYTDVLSEYSHESTLGRWTFFDNDPNQGFKFHLNVKPHNVRAVASFLLAQDYRHKYLNGADAELGKIFTVYTGSKQQTEQIVREVMKSDIAPLLEPALIKDEVSYAPNIVGRFVGDRQNFLTKIAVRGITILRETEQMDLEAAFILANQALMKRYGGYYGEGINYQS